MLELDETDLIAFFDVLPQGQPTQEREFLSATLFVKQADDLVLTFSLSPSHRDVQLELTRNALPLLSYALENVRAVSIERDRRGRSWLRATARSGERISLAVAPTIEVAIHSGGDAGA